MTHVAMIFYWSFLFLFVGGVSRLFRRRVNAELVEKAVQWGFYEPKGSG